MIEGYDHYHPTPGELAAQKMKIRLSTGKTYHVVAIGNMHTGAVHDLSVGTVFDTKVMHSVTHPDISTGNRRVDSHDHLYGGDQTIAIPPNAGTTHTIDFTSSHADMVVVGYDSFATRQGSAGLELEHRGLPPYTDFSGNCLVPRDEWISHFPNSRSDGGDTYIHEYQVMRDPSGSTIHLSDSSGELFVLDVERFMAEHLMSNPNVAGPYDQDGNLLQEASIPIRIEFKGADIDVSIPTWAPNDVTPEF